MSKKRRPPLRRIHSDATLESGASRYSLVYWRGRRTEEIIRSLYPGSEESLKVKSDGSVINGNVRVKVLEERGFDVDSLKRETA